MTHLPYIPRPNAVSIPYFPQNHIGNLAAAAAAVVAAKKIEKHRVYFIRH